MTIIQVIKTNNPQNAAYTFGAILAADKGVQNTVEQRGKSWLVIADDNRAIEFKP